MTQLILITTVILARALSPQTQDARLAQADSLFRDRDRIESLRQAARLMEQAAAEDSMSFEAQWRLARFRYYLSDREPAEAAKLRLLQSGIDAGKKAVAIDKGRVEGHFWLAANIGGYAELKGGIKAFGLVKTIRKEFSAALAIDPAYENGAIYLALGQIDIEMPGILGGSDRRGIERLEQGLKIAQTNAELKLAVAEAYMKNGKKDEAHSLLESVLKENDPVRTPAELEEIRIKARRALATDRK
jgi:predicted Zn-dependent protease